MRAGCGRDAGGVRVPGVRVPGVRVPGVRVRGARGSLGYEPTGRCLAGRYTDTVGSSAIQ